MKKILIVNFIVLSLTANAQNESQGEDFNRWSIEANVGTNRPIQPFTKDYYSSDPNKSFTFKVNHYDLGVRYMLSDAFGFKMSYAFDEFKNYSKGSPVTVPSKEFKSVQSRLNFEGVVNFGNILHFSDFTSWFNVLGHGGLQISNFNPKLGIYKDKSEFNGGFIMGFTPQFKITDNFVLNLDFSYLSNVRQHYNWDGASQVNTDNLTGSMYNMSLGVMYYLGGETDHADWVASNRFVQEDSDTDGLDQKIANLEKQNKETITKMIAMQTENANQVAKVKSLEDNLANLTKTSTAAASVSQTAKKEKYGIIDQTDAVKAFVENGYLNIFFDLNKDFPNSGSTNTVFKIIQYLKENTKYKIKLVGFTDPRGNVLKNQELSRRRAENVYKSFVSNGIDKSRISMAGKGVDNVISGNSKTDYDLARRVTVALDDK